MHELSVCQSMLLQVGRIALGRGAAAVDRIVVIVGPLSGVEPPLLERAFSVARAGTLAEYAEIEIETGAIEVLCRECGATSKVRVNNLTCRSCGDWRVEVREGEDLILKSVELSGIPAPSGSAENSAPEFSRDRR